MIEALDPSGVGCKKELLRWFTRTMLEEYDQTCAPNREGGSLGAVEVCFPACVHCCAHTVTTQRRYPFARRLFAKFEKDFMETKVFPHSWNVEAILARDFCVMSERSCHAHCVVDYLPMLLLIGCSAGAHNAHSAGRERQI